MPENLPLVRPGIWLVLSRGQYVHCISLFCLTPNCCPTWFSKILSIIREGNSICSVFVQHLVQWDILLPDHGCSVISQYIITIIKSVSLKELLIQTSVAPWHCEILPPESWPEMSDVHSAIVPFQLAKQSWCTAYFYPCSFRVLNNKRQHLKLWVFPTGPDSKPLGVNSFHLFRKFEINPNICGM